jgi:poly(3-hydroxybutyrate) depolymerase
VSGISAQNSLGVQTLYNSNFDIDGIPRSCAFYIPLKYGKTETLPLLIMLHDKNSNVKALVKNYGDIMHAIADSVGAVIIYPSVVAGTWHDSSIKDSVNDVGYISILIDYFVQRYQCSAAQVYIAGIGNGAAMAMRFSCDLPEKVAAAAALLYIGKPACENLSVPLMPAEKIVTPNAKITNTILSDMWRFFLEHKKEQEENFIDPALE